MGGTRSRVMKRVNRGMTRVETRVFSKWGHPIWDVVTLGTSTREPPETQGGSAKRLEHPHFSGFFSWDVPDSWRWRQ